MEISVKNSGIFRAVLPSLFITLSIGSVYAFSFFANNIAQEIGSNLGSVQFAFSLSIFFLGMGAAFFGSIVEKNIRFSALISTVLFALGMCCTTIGIQLKNLWIVFLGYGVLNGVAQGIGYLSPVKNLMLWYPTRKGLMSAISIVSFGLGSSLCVFLSKLLIPSVGFQWVFLSLGAIYFVMMLIGSFLLKKPCSADQKIVSSKSGDFSYRKILTDRTFWQYWVFMLLNITGGLVLIGASKNIFSEIISSGSIVVGLMMLCGIFNGGFRLIFAWISDFLKNRTTIWVIITAISGLFVLASLLEYSIIIPTILLINATYGGGFSTCPAILSDHYGNSGISRIHGLLLSAWGIAAIPSYFFNYTVFTHLDSFRSIPMILLGLYFVNLINVLTLRSKKV